MNYKHKGTGQVVWVEDRSETDVAFHDGHDTVHMDPLDFDSDFEPVSPAPAARYRHLAGGGIVEVYKRENGVVYFAPQGGGFVKHTTQDIFDRMFEPAPEPQYLRGTVTADWLAEGQTIPCVSNGDRWNGWAMPYFDRDTVNELIALMPGALRWKDEREYEVVATLVDVDVDEQEEWTPHTLTLANGEQLVEMWPIGAGSWCWDGFEPDPKEAAQMLLGEMDKAYEERPDKTVASWAGDTWPPQQKAAKTDTEMLDWLLAHPHVRVRGSLTTGFVVMDCSDGLTILAECEESPRSAIAAAMNKEKDNGN